MVDSQIALVEHHGRSNFLKTSRAQDIAQIHHALGTKSQQDQVNPSKKDISQRTYTFGTLNAGCTCIF